MSEKKSRHSRHMPAFVLLTIALNPAHGGAILSLLRRDLPGLNVDSAGVYRTLKTLETDGEIGFTWDTAEPGPARKIYHVTPAGLAKLMSWQQDIKNRQAMLGQFLAGFERLNLAKPAAVDNPPPKPEPTPQMPGEQATNHLSPVCPTAPPQTPTAPVQTNRPSPLRILLKPFRSRSDSDFFWIP